MVPLASMTMKPLGAALNAPTSRSLRCVSDATAGALASVMVLPEEPG
jgi:hypothetical protein